MNKSRFRKLTWTGGLFCLVCALAGCSSVTGTYADSTGSVTLNVQSGGKATMTFMGMTEQCTYTTASKQLTLNCPGQMQGAVFTINDDGSLNGPADSLIPVLKKTK